MYIYVYMYIYIHAYRLFFHAAVVFYAPVQQKNKYLLYSIYIYIYIYLILAVYQWNIKGNEKKDIGVQAKGHEKHWDTKEK